MSTGAFYCLGPVVLDKVVKVDNLPGHDEKAFIQSMTDVAGGPPRNVAAALARWREEALLMAPVGDDETGRSLLASLEEIGLTTSGIDIVSGMATAFTIVILDDTGEKAILIDPLGEDTLARIGRRLAPKPHDIVITNLYHAGAVATAMKRARAAGARAALDLELPEAKRWGWEQAFEVARLADFVIANAQLLAGWIEFEKLDLPMAEAGERLVQFLARNGSRACVTFGAGGLIACDGETTFTLPALPITPKNTTGAGDVFLAAFAKMSGEGRGFKQALIFASTAAGLFVEGGLPDWSTVERRAQPLIDERIR
ncbi:carbohydrate kinase family protein [Mesorhizobium sp. BAC0120]|uniref:carbohydrate kinase family protein n=1 Tax=Mesorhizobium sp. BAC0120 TaxID=3090670 RepID=UPI00298CB15B|nr:carbohydrate kinase family protein [Mesorhizobium sp. BAC0120]MDW6021628.1 carbohydrate kinase family protein [Mesorhizobium sp. BAC0120]